jgi:hypothetical protein
MAKGFGACVYCDVYHGMECNRTEGFGNHLGMTHRIGRVLVAGGSGCGIIDPFESKTGVGTEAARLFRV